MCIRDRNGSALENLVLSKIVNAPAISTWEGMQTALRVGTSIYEIWSAGNSVLNPTDPTYFRTFDSSIVGYRRSLSLSRVSSLVTAVSAGHKFVTGQQVDIRGATQPEYNGTFT